MGKVYQIPADHTQDKENAPTDSTFQKTESYDQVMTDTQELSD